MSSSMRKAGQRFGGLGQHICGPGQGTDGVELAGFEERRDHRPALRAVLVVGEEYILARQSDGRIFRRLLRKCLETLRAGFLQTRRGRGIRPWLDRIIENKQPRVVDFCALLRVRNVSGLK
jgi:hypothetical protein